MCSDVSLYAVLAIFGGPPHCICVCVCVARLIKLCGMLIIELGTILRGYAHSHTYTLHTKKRTHTNKANYILCTVPIVLFVATP